MTHVNDMEKCHDTLNCPKLEQRCYSLSVQRQNEENHSIQAEQETLVETTDHIMDLNHGQDQAKQLSTVNVYVIYQCVED